MSPPKKDAFSELFNYAHGGSSRSSPSSSLNDLSSNPTAQSQVRPTNTNVWGNLDILTPTRQISPSGSKPQTPLGGKSSEIIGAMNNSSVSAVENDPFAVFEKQTTSEQAIPIKSTVTDPFDFFELNSRTETSQPQNKSTTSVSEADSNAPKLPNRSGKGTSFLDDDFTDAFPSKSQEPIEEPNEFAELSRTSSTEKDNTFSNDRDHTLAALMSEGISIDLANRAIDRMGPDFEKCMRLIVMRSVRPRTEKQASSSKDSGGAFQDMSNDLYKKATLFFDKSRKTVIKNINNLQNQRARREGSDMPAWIATQHKYKGQAAERKEGGGTYEDYGTDDENIDEDEIKRIVQIQRQKELERQRKRLEAMGKSKGQNQSNGSAEKLSKPQESSKVTSHPTAYLRQTARASTQHDVPRSEYPTRGANSSSSSSLQSAGSSRSNQSSKFSPASPLPLSTKPAKPTDSVPRSPKTEAPEADLLGLGNSATPLTRAQQFKQGIESDSAYISPSRRRQTKSQSSTLTSRPATSEPLNTFAQSDYDTHKAKGAEAFTSGDYDYALQAYEKCLLSLPSNHELRIVITANLALTAIKIGNYRLALKNCEEGLMLVGEHVSDSEWTISEKNVKYWYVRLLARKAESLEMLENFSASLECYTLLVSQYGVNDKKTMDAKRRVANILKPPRPTRKPVSNPVSSTTANSTANNQKLDHVKKHHLQEKLQEQQEFQLHDVVNDKIQLWSNGKEDNLRSLLMSLGDVLPQHLGFSFISSKKITINDLMLTKKVKIHYMKVISNIHPDKLGGLKLEDQMICQAVFVTLNKAWDAFKVQNNIA